MNDGIKEEFHKMEVDTSSITDEQWLNLIKSRVQSIVHPASYSILEEATVADWPTKLVEAIQSDTLLDILIQSLGKEEV